MSPADKENSDAVSQVSALRSAIEKEIGVTMADAREDVSPGTLQVVIFPKA
jgi:Ethanolamine utilization protein EutJ (predicted chaperonin)